MSNDGTDFVNSIINLSATREMSGTGSLYPGCTTNYPMDYPAAGKSGEDSYKVPGTKYAPMTCQGALQAPATRL